MIARAHGRWRMLLGAVMALALLPFGHGAAAQQPKL